jgi:pimeloyl-ACP methyl ester carboxylesterase
MKNALCSAFAAPALALLLAGGCASSPEGREASTSLANAKSHFATFGTNKIHYVILGKGKKAIVLVHCWSGNLGFWREQVPALADKARLVLVDLPGHGRSDKPHTAYTMDFFAASVLAVMSDAGIDKATLVGHSMGVAVICRVLAQAPERVAALVAVDGTLRGRKMTPEQGEQFIARFRAADYREKTRQFVGTMFPVPGTEAVRERVVSELLETPQYVMLGAMEGMFGAGQPDWDPRHVNVPVLVINASNPMWTDAYKEYVRSLSTQTDYRSIDGVGHWLMLEKPAEFNASLLDMLHKFDLIGN